jgi:hypothetical protein
VLATVEGPAADALKAHLEATKPAAAAAAAAAGLDASAGVQWTHVSSVFVKVEASLDGSRLPTALRLCLPLLLESTFKLGVVGCENQKNARRSIYRAVF